MELLFVVLIAASSGLLVRAITRGADTYGAAVLPAVNAAVSAIIWVALLWAGLKFDGTWIWVYSLVGGALVAFVVGMVLPRRRRESDRAMLARLSGAKA